MFGEARSRVNRRGGQAARGCHSEGVIASAFIASAVSLVCGLPCFPVLEARDAKTKRRRRCGPPPARRGDDAGPGGGHSSLRDPALAGGGLPPGTEWPFSGRDIHNTRNAADEHVLDPSEVADLKPRWTVTTDGNVERDSCRGRRSRLRSGLRRQPLGDRRRDRRGRLEKGDRRLHGRQGRRVAHDASRLARLLILGEGTQTVTTLEGASLFALDAKSGRPLWLTKVESDPVAIITSSAVVDDGVVYVGIVKAEAQKTPSTFRGSVLALSAETGKVLWQTYLTGDGYTGAAAWGSTPVVDHDAGLLYVATGNNYSVPAAVCRAPDALDCTRRPRTITSTASWRSISRPAASPGRRAR